MDTKPDLSKLTRLPNAEYDETLRDIPCEGQYLTYPYQYSFRRGSISFGLDQEFKLINREI